MRARAFVHRHIQYGPRPSCLATTYAQRARIDCEALRKTWQIELVDADYLS